MFYEGNIAASRREFHHPVRYQSQWNNFDSAELGNEERLKLKNYGLLLIKRNNSTIQ